MLAELPVVPPVAWATNLGYRGFVVRTDEAQPSVVRVQRGAIHVSQGAYDRYHQDPTRDVERWLLRTGQGALDPDICRIVEDELSR